MKRKIVLICGRENLSEDLDFHTRIYEYLETLDLEILYESTDLEFFKTKTLLSSVLKYVRSFMRSHLNLFLRFDNRIQTRLQTERRVMALKILLKTFDWNQIDLVIIGRSAGAIVASNLALEFPIKAVIALGYPFIHPDYGMQSYRVKHLVHVQIPMFVFQGINDGYGNAEQVASIPFSATTHIIPLETDHAFILDKPTWLEFTNKLAEILE
jgi:hypothetical protein